jgi:hypothetical protein
MPDFLTVEAISNYITFALGIIFGILGWLFVRWLGRKKPRIVRVAKVREISLLEVDSAIKDEVSIAYKGNSIESLYLNEFVIQNSSDETIDDVEIVIHFDNSGIIEVHKEDPILKRNSMITKSNAGDELQIIVPYINEEKLYKDLISITVFSLNPLRPIEVTGGGRGWSVSFFDRIQLTTDIANELTDELLAYGPDVMLRNPLGALWALLRLVPKFLDYWNHR